MAVAAELPPSHAVARATGTVARTLAAALAIVLALVAATGWLYRLRTTGALAIGPRFAGALPLQQLAGSDAQPLARLALAWIPAGAVAGAALSRLTRLGRAACAAAIAAGSWAVLILAGAVSDAVAVSDRLAPHVAPQLARPGTLAAVALLALGAVLARGRR